MPKLGGFWLSFNGGLPFWLEGIEPVESGRVRILPDFALELEDLTSDSRDGLLQESSARFCLAWSVVSRDLSEVLRWRRTSVSVASDDDRLSSIREVEGEGPGCSDEDGKVTRA